MKLSDLQEGDKIKFGRYQVESEEPEKIIWEIAGKDLYDNPNSVTFISEKILDLRAFDGEEPNNPDSSRKQYGNNKYSVSNIDQWLNSKEQDWYKPQHDYDTYPDNTNTVNGTGYNTRPGFLYNFTENEINNIIPSTIRVALNTVTDGGSYEDITRKVFLPSTTEMGLANENNIVEGTKFFDTISGSNTNRKRTLTTQAFNNTASTSKPSDVTSAWYYWLRTPHSGNSYYSRSVSRSGTLSSDIAYNGYCGIHPCLTLSNDVLISDTKDSDGCYLTILTPWSDSWSYNSTHHWHDCLFGDCLDITDNSQKDGYGEHESSDWIITKEPTFEETGSKHKICTVCGYELEVQEIPIKQKTLKDLSTGSKIRFGHYQVENETPEHITWIMGTKNHYKEGYIPFVTEYIIDLRAFDGKDDTYTKGNADYYYSNINQWLNSNKPAGEWYENTNPPTDENTNNSGTGYDDKPGFLYYFNSKEQNLIESVSIISGIPYVSGTPGQYRTLIKKVFLLGQKELGLTPQANAVTEGTMWSIFSTDNSRKCTLSPQCFNNTLSNSKPSSLTTTWKYWTRSPWFGTNYMPIVIGVNGTETGDDSYNGTIGVRPALNLPDNLTVTLADDGYYDLDLYQWSEEWSYNSTHHWHECLGDECPEDMLDEQKSGYAPHTPSDWQIIKEPTDFERGIKIKTCTVCGAEVARQEIPKLTEKVLELQPLDAIKTNRVVTEMYSNTLITCESEYAISIEACNNGFDNNPTWEDITEPVLKKKKATLSNDTKTADDWGVNIKITLSKETGTAPLVLDGLVFSYN